MKDNIHFFQKVIKDFLWRYPTGTIVNMGNPLKTIYQEVKNGKIKWYELDLPGEFEQKAKTDDGRIFIQSTILIDDWPEQIGSQETILFVAEGIFSYCAEKKVRSMFSHLCAVFPSFELLFNVISPLGIRIWNHVIRKTGMNEPFTRWGLRNPGKVIKWNARFNPLGIYRVYLLPDSPGKINNLLLRIFCQWRIFHLRVRYNYRKLKA